MSDVRLQLNVCRLLCMPACVWEHMRAACLAAVTGWLTRSLCQVHRGLWYTLQDASRGQCQMLLCPRLVSIHVTICSSICHTQWLAMFMMNDGKVWKNAPNPAEIRLSMVVPFCVCIHSMSVVEEIFYLICYFSKKIAPFHWHPKFDLLKVIFVSRILPTNPEICRSLSLHFPNPQTYTFEVDRSAVVDENPWAERLRFLDLIVGCIMPDSLNAIVSGLFAVRLWFSSNTFSRTSCLAGQPGQIARSFWLMNKKWTPLEVKVAFPT